MIKLGRMLIKVIEVYSDFPPRIEADVNISDNDSEVNKT
jgi:hypothetical protein